MKILYLDCFAGISGDMWLGALLDLGVPEEQLRAELNKLPLQGYRIETRRVTRHHIAATQFKCIVQPEPRPHRGFTEIASMIGNSPLPENVRLRAINAFRRLAEAEAKIHGIPPQQVHFHEIGAVDSIVDIVGVCVAMHALAPDQVQATPPPLGTGLVQTAHGTFPLPAPATLELLRGVPTRSSPIQSELVTPTGAALLVEFCQTFGPMPGLVTEKIGYGAGSRELDNLPNVLRAVLGVACTQQADIITVIETNIDDMNPQWYPALTEQLLANGAMDVYLTPVQMKKNRPGTLLTVLSTPADADRLAELVLTHTTSFGVRLYDARRRKLAREIRKVNTPYGEIEVKIGRLDGKILSCSPEYESCKRAAERTGVPIKTIYAVALQATEEIRHD
ncbi:MAG: nickel pincer cofactor biosynthesis protein LarC [Verrucomicrobiae bacterium]|nr:nickel pincer cofactor biosynthesis protein LarC [Verrucomicrobiae bacterium]